MITRYNRVWSYPEVKQCPVKIDYELITKINPISFNDDKSVKEYTEDQIFVERKSKWSDYIKSFDLGSVSDQVLSHIEKGTPLITAHTLPHADFTNLQKGAEIVREMREKGITLEMLESIMSSDKSKSGSSEKVIEKVIKEENNSVSSEGDK